VTIVREFHQAFGLPAPERPAVPDDDTIDMRVTLLCEEFAEVMGALYNCGEPDTRLLAANVRNEVEAMAEARRAWGPSVDMHPRMTDLAKELADLRYVTDGCGVAFGFPVEAVFRAVHDSNMSKLQPDGSIAYREDGKVLKSDDYVPAEPAVRGLLQAAGRRHTQDCEDYRFVHHASTGGDAECICDAR
jgi:predicted HAD superfamily Cof-like phosphohydrolase